MADLLYSSPYDAFLSAQSTGGWVGVEAVDGVRCHHLAVQQEAVDWELWIREAGEPLPCKLRLVYKSDPGPPSSEIRFRDWDLAPVLAPCAEPAWTVQARTADELRAELLAGAAERLAGNGWQLLPEGARMLTSRPWEPGAGWQVTPRWTVADGPMRLPLAFDLAPLVRDGDAPEPITAWLTAPLRREVLALRHAVRRGEPVRCEDMTTVLRPFEAVPSGALAGRCALESPAVARRPLGAGDLLRGSDVGIAPSVAARADVRLRVRVGQVTIEKAGTALADGNTGDAVLVRLAGSAQALRGVVVGTNLVEVGEER
jgi:flagella basal body P-ring formation protein FlgA